MSNDKEFNEWFRNKDFTILNKMKSEFIPEYYARSAYFHQQEIIDAKDKEIERYKKALSNKEKRSFIRGSFK